METNNCASSLERHNTFCNTDRSQHCACIRSKMAEQKKQCLLEDLDGSPDPTGSESRRREREKTLTVTTQLVVTSFGISLLPYLIVACMGIYSSDYREQD